MYRTLASTGYIITSSPIAIGSETDPILSESSSVVRPLEVRPRTRPRAIATMIQTGRNRSSRDRRPTTASAVMSIDVEGAASLTVILRGS